MLTSSRSERATGAFGGTLAEHPERGEEALQHKLNAVADGLADLMEHFAEEDPERREAKEDLAGDIEDLRAAVGLEGEM